MRKKPGKGEEVAHSRRDKGGKRIKTEKPKFEIEIFSYNFEPKGWDFVQRTEQNAFDKLGALLIGAGLARLPVVIAMPATGAVADMRPALTEVAARIQSLFHNTYFAERLLSDKQYVPTIRQIEGPVIDEKNPNEILHLYLKVLDAPTSERAMLVSKMRHMVAAALVHKFSRPQWLEERSKPDSELGMLSAPAFLRRVYADVIGSEGFVFKEYIREMDADLMAAVDTYLSQRTGRGRGLGHAYGLTFVASRPGRPRQAKPKSPKGVAP
jgi:hypothetical protein